MINSKLSQQWTELLKQQKTSGLSITKFCQEEEVRINQFYYWKKRLTKNDKPEKASSLFSKVDIEKNIPRTEFSPVWIAKFLKELLK